MTRKRASNPDGDLGVRYDKRNQILYFAETGQRYDLMDPKNDYLKGYVDRLDWPSLSFILHGLGREDE